MNSTQSALYLSARASAGLGGCVIAGVSVQGWDAQRVMAQSLPGVSYTVGIHPWTVHDQDGSKSPDTSIAQLADYLQTHLQTHASVIGSRLVGVGELGLDRSRRYKSSIQAQVRSCQAQLRLAQQHRLPVVLHVVRAHGRMLSLIDESGLGAGGAGGMVHSFVGNTQVAAQWIARGFMISVSPASLRSPRTCQALAELPTSMLLIETDGPQPGQERWGLEQVCAGLAEIRGDTVEAVAAYTAQNTRQLFSLG